MGRFEEREVVLHPLDTEEDEINNMARSLADFCKEYDLDLDGSQAQQCVEYLLFILQVNSYINLTSIRDVEDALVLHLLDSLLFCSIAPATFNRFLDMGTGGGFPGVPFHIKTGRPGLLVDSVGKKLKAVNAVVKELNIQDIELKHGRIETLALAQQENYDVVLARALAPIATLVEYASPFLCIGGVLLISKGVPEEIEIEQGVFAGHQCGLELVRSSEVFLPDEYGVRNLMVFKKEFSPSIPLPRAVGLAKKNPLV